MNPNTIASDTLVEAVARAMADEMKSNSVYASDDLRNCLIDGGLFDLHGTARAALTAIADAGYAIVRVEPSMAQIVMLGAPGGPLEERGIDAGDIPLIDIYEAVIETGRANL